MALINIDNIVQDILRLLKNTDANTGLEIMSYKRNRAISITRIDDKDFLVIENGYVHDENTINSELLGKHLKKLVKKEFPRSKKVRIFKFTDPEQLDRHHQKRHDPKSFVFL